MTSEEAIANWERACPAAESKGRWVRDGNWVPVAFALRHADCKAASVTVVEESPSTILKVEPVTLEEVPKGKSRGVRKAFYLIVT